MLLKRLREMLLEFLLIAAGMLICTAVFCTLFIPGMQATVTLLWQIIVLSLLCTLPGLIFHSKREIGKRQMRIRIVLHLAMLLALLLSMAYHWGWIEPRSVIQTLVFIAMFAAVYAMVFSFMYLHEKHVADKLNEGLKSYQRRKAQ